MPGNGTITICHRLDEAIVEMRCLKYYLLQHWNVGMFYKHVVNKIQDDLKTLQIFVAGESTLRVGVNFPGTASYEKD